MLAKSTLLAIALAGTGAPAAPVGGEAPRLFPHSISVMGTYATLSVAGTDSLAAVDAARAAERALVAVDALMSNWTDSSEVARINRHLGPRPMPIHPEVHSVLAAALDVGRASQGAFDITVEPLVRAWGFLGGSPRVPTQREIDAARARTGLAHVRLGPGTIASDRTGLRIDLGGVAKGYAVDRALDSLRAQGIDAALVDLSGNMAALGAPPGRDSWVIGVRDPRDRSPYFATLRLESDAVATSADYEQFVSHDGKRYGHILDPRTGWPAEGLAAVTVLAPSACAADAWATAFFVLGLDDGRRVAMEREELHVVFVEPDREGSTVVWVEESLRGRFRVVGERAEDFAVRWFGTESAR